MKTGCGAWFAVYLVLAAGLAAFLNQRFPGAGALGSDTPRLEVVVGAGLVDALFVHSMLASAWAPLRDQGQLDRAWEGKLPADGAHGVFYGPIRRDLYAALSRQAGWSSGSSGGMEPRISRPGVRRSLWGQTRRSADPTPGACYRVRRESPGL